MTPLSDTSTILIVDDTPSNLGVVVDMLEDCGYRVAIALDGEEGLQRAQLVLPDLILLDVMMPDIDGFEICRRLKTLDATQDIPVIFMTSLASTEHKVKGFDVGGVDYLTKPLQIEEVIARAGTHLKLYEAQRQLQKQRDGLELRVAERTEELAVSNLQLRVEIAERKRAEDLLHAREQEFRAMVENSPDIIARYDTQCRRIYVNPAMRAEFGLTVEEILGKTPDDISPMPEVRAYMQRIQSVLENGREELMEFSWNSIQNGERWGHMRLVPEFGTDGAVASVLAVTRDITERKRAEHLIEESRNQLRGLAAQNEAVREEERKYIAREVHDELGQILTGLQMDLSMLSYKFGADLPALREHLQGTLELVNKSLATTRNVASSLRPGSLDMGIVPAIEWLVERFSKNTGINCKMHVCDEDRNIELDENFSIALFRITQESLTNIARHAKASKVVVSFSQDGDDYLLEVRDNGIGFDPATIKNGSFGLVGIRERVNMLGGEHIISSKPGGGTVIEVRLPIHKFAEEE